MYAVEVSLIQKRSHQYSFTYFAKENYDPGALLLVPFQKREVIALTISSQPLQALRQDLRRSDFTTKKVIGLAERQVESAFTKAVIATADQYLVQPGALLHLLTPEEYSDEGDQTTPASAKTYTGLIPERIENHKKTIRAELSKGKSVVMCLPTAAFVDAFVNKFSDIENVVPVHHQLPKKALQANTQKLTDGDAALYVITPYFMWAKPKNCSTLIIEHALHKYWYTPVYPFVNLKDFAVSLGQNRGWETIVADTLTPDQSAQHADLLAATIQLNEKESGEIFSTKAIESIEKSKKVFIYSNRTGLATVVTCRDCGATMQNEDGKSYKLIEKDGQRWFSTGSTKTNAFDTCPHCEGNRLELSGLAAGQIHEKLQQEFPNRELITINKESASTLNKLKKLISKIEESEDIIVIGGEIISPWLNQGMFNLAIIPSGYQLSHINQTYFIEETVSLLSAIENSAKHTSLEFYQEPPRHLGWLAGKNFEAAYRSTNSMREKLSQAPFGHTIEVATPNKKQSDRLAQILETEAIPLIQDENKLTIPSKTLPLPLNISKLLLSLGKEFKIRVDSPEIS